MKNLTSGNEVIHKEVVIIGNGPSGLALSAMLSGLVPHLVSHAHPDEMLAARLASSGAAATPRSLAQLQPLLDQLAAGLEGRTTNPVSLLLDALEHPCADLGLEMTPLVQWQRHSEHQIDHVVLGKGPPGGSWHTMDPNVLTLSLGSWMALPGLPYTPADSDTASADSQRRASAGAVARYYQHYVNEMHLEPFLESGMTVTSIEPIHDPSISVANSLTERNRRNSKCDTVVETRRKCSLVNALNFIKSRTKCSKKPKDQTCVVRTCKRPRDITKHDSPNRKVKSYFSVDQSLYFSRISRENLDDVLVCDPDNFYTKSNKIRSLSFSCDSDFTIESCDKVVTNQKHNSLINVSDCRLCNCYVPEDLDMEMEILCECLDESNTKDSSASTRWIVQSVDSAGAPQTYTCNNLVLANGASDLPNRLGLSAETYDLPWVLHDLRTLEDKLDDFAREMGDSPDPVLVVGAGLSAADAVIATRFRSIPVLHVFRNKSVSLDKQLPENMYPEYHKVHQMMLDGGSTYPLYTSLPEHAVTEISASDKTVTIESKSGVPTRYKVSFAVILIGSRPNLTFLPTEWSLGVNKTLPVDAKTNPMDINTLNHAVSGYEGLYAIGPLAGDNFVRFIPGGALAVVSDLYRKKNW